MNFVLCFASADVTDQNKGLSVLLECIRAMAEMQPMTLIVFGSGVHAAGRRPRTRLILLGTVSSAAVQCIAYSAADVFVMPSRVESFGLTALEAMSCGTPIVAFRTGGLPDLVDHGRTGLLEDEIASAVALQRALRWMQEHPSERECMGWCAARAQLEEKFSTDVMAQRYTDLYASLLSE